MIEHHAVGIFDPADQLILVKGIERNDVGNVAEDAAFDIEGFSDKIGDDKAGTGRLHTEEVPVEGGWIEAKLGLPTQIAIRHTRNSPNLSPDMHCMRNCSGGTDQNERRWRNTPTPANTKPISPAVKPPSGT